MQNSSAESIHVSRTNFSVFFATQFDTSFSCNLPRTVLGTFGTFHLHRLLPCWYHFSADILLVVQHWQNLDICIIWRRDDIGLSSISVNFYFTSELWRAKDEMWKENVVHPCMFPVSFGSYCNFVVRRIFYHWCTSVSLLVFDKCPSLWKMIDSSLPVVCLKCCKNWFTVLLFLAVRPVWLLEWRVLPCIIDSSHPWIQF